MSPGFVLGQENVPCIAQVVNRSLKADCTDFMHFSDESVSYHVNDRFNFEVTDRSFSQRSNFLFQKQTKNVICFQYCLIC